MADRERVLVSVGILLLAVVLLGLAWSLTQDVTMALAVLAALLVVSLLVARASRSRGRPEALTDEQAIATRLEALRAGASAFSAIWSGTYADVEVERYFEAERRALDTNKSLHINRIINPTVIQPKHHNLLLSIRSQFGSRFQLHEDPSIHSFELYVAEYTGKEPVAVVVVNDMLNKRPKVGLVLDPSRNPRLAGAVGAVREWFHALREPLRVFDPVASERWDSIAPRYTKHVTQNANRISFLETYTTEECERVGGYLASLADPGRGLSIVEIGCGDGRALFRYIPPDLASSVSYVIGLDYAQEMVRVAEAELARRRSTSEERLPGARELTQKTGFYRVNGFELRRFFEDGRLRDPEQLMTTASGEATRVDPSTFMASRKVFCCFLNTLGVIEPRERRKALVEAMLAALGIDDRLVLAVFAADAFAEHAEDLYKGLEEMLDMKVEEDHFNPQDTTFHIDGSPGYFSRWFTEAELRDLMNEAVLELGRLGRAFDPPAVVPMASGGYFVDIRRAG